MTKTRSDGLVVLVPVLGRPHRVAPLLASIEDTAPTARVLFLSDPDDTDEQDAIREAGGEMRICRGNYARKIRAGVGATSERLVLTGADDLTFRDGWFEAALRCLSPPVEVVGVNDLIDRTREHATHFLMTREYAERPTIDGAAPGPFCHQYDHSYCDDELIATARKRGVYAYARDAHVEHLHPDNEKAEWDDVYRKGRARIREDGMLFRRRYRRYLQ